MNIYIACALTHLPRGQFKTYSSYIHDLANKLKKQRHDVKYALINSDPQLAKKGESEKSRLCYLWDKEMVENADLIIAEASFPSTGLGIEMQIADAKNIPIIVLFKDYGSNKSSPVCYENPDHQEHTLQIGEGYVSLMALGIPSVFQVIKYNEPQDGISVTLKAVKSLIASRYSRQDGRELPCTLLSSNVK
jgi:hypothetical protein